MESRESVFAGTPSASGETEQQSEANKKTMPPELNEKHLMDSQVVAGKQESITPESELLTKEEQEKRTELKQIRTHVEGSYGKLGIYPDEIDVREYTSSQYKITFFGFISRVYSYRAHSAWDGVNKKWDQYNLDGLRLSFSSSRIHCFSFKRLKKRDVWVVIKCFGSNAEEKGIFAKNLTTGHIVKGQKAESLWNTQGLQETQIPEKTEFRDSNMQWQYDFPTFNHPRLKVTQALVESDKRQKEKPRTVSKKRPTLSRSERQKLVEDQISDEFAYRNE